MQSQQTTVDNHRNGQATRQQGDCCNATTDCSAVLKQALLTLQPPASGHRVARNMKSRKPQSKPTGRRTVQAAPHLPDEVIVNILRHIPQEDRLSSCALGCTAWASAAAAATSDIYISEDSSSPKAARSLSNWLLQYTQAGQVQSIHIPQPTGCQANKLVLYTPHYTQLHTLHLHSCSVGLFHSINSQQMILPDDLKDFTQQGPHVLPALQVLSLIKCTLPSAGLSALSLPRLTSLALDSTPDSVSEREVAKAVTALCRQMPCLRQLQLSRMRGTNAALAQLSRLRRLQSFSLEMCFQITPEVLSGLCSRLKYLKCSSCPGAFAYECLPEAGWPYLRELHLDHIVLQPAALADLTTLEVLDLWDCELIPGEEVEVEHGLEEDAGGASDLLAALAHMTRLRQLDLREIDLQSIIEHQQDVQWAEFAAEHDSEDEVDECQFRAAFDGSFKTQFKSLTASSRLERLAIAYRDPEIRIHPLPRHPCVLKEVMLRPGQQLLHLTELVIDGFDRDVVDKVFGDPDAAAHKQYGDPYEHHWCLDCWDVNVIATCCPNLLRLTLNCVIAPHEESVERSLRKLRRELQHLQFLGLGGPWITNETAPVLATMTGLSGLQVCNSPYIRANGIEKLITLRGLRSLDVCGLGWKRAITFCLETDETRRPDVWQQLAILLPSIRAEQEELGAEDCEVASEDADIDDDSDNGWYEEWVHMDSDLEEDGPPTDLSGASGDDSGSEAGERLSEDADGGPEEV